MMTVFICKSSERIRIEIVPAHGKAAAHALSLRLRGRNRAVWPRQRVKRYPACGMAAFPLPPPPLRQARRGRQVRKIGGTMQSASLCPKAHVPKSLASCDASRLSPADWGVEPRHKMTPSKQQSRHTLRNLLVQRGEPYTRSVLAPLFYRPRKDLSRKKSCEHMCVRNFLGF